MRTGEDTIDTLHANRKMEARFHLMNLTQTPKPKANRTQLEWIQVL